MSGFRVLGSRVVEFKVQASGFIGMLDVVRARA